MYGIEYLRKKLAQKKNRVDKRYSYYEMKEYVRDLNISTPPELRWLTETLGWCAKAVDSVADRIQFYGFKNDAFNFTDIYNLNSKDVLIDSAVLSALITSCSFIYISGDEDGNPRLQNIDGGHATGIIDPITNMLTEGYAVLSEDEAGNPQTEAYFVPYRTEIYNGEKLVDVFTYPAPYALLVPIINRPDARRQFGRSRISRACMGIQDSAIRTIKRSEISAEFFSIPQKYVTGLDQNAEPMEKWRATMSTLLSFTKDEDGDHPSVGQFQQQSMTPHVEQIKGFASLFAGETGLTIDDLGFSTANPSSSEAIKASHENLRLYASKCQKTMGVGFINAGYLACCLRDKYSYTRNAMYETEVVYEPMFATDFSQLSSMGDGILKMNQSVDGYFDKENIRILTGIPYGNS